VCKRDVCGLPRRTALLDKRHLDCLTRIAIFWDCLRSTMSGAEAVGFLLGVLPLVFSAVEHYEDALRPFIRYRKFSSKLQRFHDELEVERTIFRTECLFLLATTVKGDTAAQMLDDRDHRLWKDNALRERFGRQLGTLGFACESVISTIEDKLDEINAKSDELNAVVSLPIQKEKFGDRNWRHRLGQKLKFSFSELGMQRSMTDLRKLNKNFQRLSNQVVRLDVQYSSNEQTMSPEEKGQALERFQMVQKASTHLYESLTRACTMHSEHLARFGLETACSIANDKSRSYHIHFSLAFTHADSGSHPDPTAQIYYSDMKCSAPVDSESLRTMISATELIVGDVHGKDAQVQPVHKRGLLPTTLAASQPKQPWPVASNRMAWFEVESVIGESPASNGQTDSSHEPESISDSVKVAGDPIFPDLADTALLVVTRSQDFCAQLGMSMCQSIPFPSSTFVGVLEQTATCRHLVRQPTAPAQLEEASTPLAQFVSQISSRGQANETPQFQRLHLAKSLAIAVLQFHTTPWLAESWHSNNILVSGARKAGSGQRSSFCSPYLNVRVAQRKDTADSPDAILSPQSMMSIAPNLLLFRLGVIFLELAYGATFQSLRDSQGSESLPADSRVADFLFARQLADGVGESLGADFASIVRKCLRCDFGCGEDLNNPALQARLYEDVVCKLEDYEVGFKKLQSKV
jgi:hypothetical protein